MRTTIKLLVFFLIIGSFVFVLKKIARTNSVYDQADKLTTLSAADTSFFFIGSSRVQKSIDPEIIRNHYGNFQIFNVGISGGSFLSSCVVADFMIRRQGHKVLFIELAPLLDELPDGLFTLSSQTGLSASRPVIALTESQSFSEQSMLIMKIVNDQLYKSITVGNEVRNVIRYKINHDDDKLVGFNPYDKNDCRTVNSFLTWDEINTRPVHSIDLTKYNAMINYLEDLAETNDAQIVFFLPITSKGQETSIIIPLYRALPDSIKLKFPTSFLKQMEKAEYLGDESHLNRRGASAYSTLILPLLD
jgi:hypothetical protein